MKKIKIIFILTGSQILKVCTCTIYVLCCVIHRLPLSPCYVQFCVILGEEENLRNKNGHLVYDVNSADLHDANSYPNYSKVKLRIEVIQEAGEIIYVPSGWHHQVYNLVSIEC